MCIRDRLFNGALPRNCPLFLLVVASFGSMIFQTPKSSGQTDIEWLKYSRWCAKKCIPPIMIDLYHLIERRLQKSRQCLHQSGLPLLKRTFLDELFPGSKDYSVAVSMQHLYA